jgi:plastocyanin
MTRRALAALAALAIVSSAGPIARATPAACASPCSIIASSAGYIAPSVEIAEGTTVHWTSIDTSHPTTDDRIDPCFIAQAGPETPLIPVKFTVAAQTLRATIGTTTRTCDGAVAVDEGTFILPYQCLLHPWMHGALIVTSG